jgi:hypothetical protein
MNGSQPHLLLLLPAVSVSLEVQVVSCRPLNKATRQENHGLLMLTMSYSLVNLGSPARQSISTTFFGLVPKMPRVCLLTPRFLWFRVLVSRDR